MNSRVLWSSIRWIRELKWCGRACTCSFQTLPHFAFPNLLLLPRAFQGCTHSVQPWTFLVRLWCRRWIIVQARSLTRGPACRCCIIQTSK